MVFFRCLGLFVVYCCLFGFLIVLLIFLFLVLLLFDCLREIWFVICGCLDCLGLPGFDWLCLVFVC